MRYAEPIERLITALSRLPGVGKKSAARLAIYILNADDGYARELAESVSGVKAGVRLCARCMAFSDSSPCKVCTDPARDPSTVCVVSDFKDMVALESSGGYRGAYHVLHGSLAPLKGIGPDDIRISELIKRLDEGGVREVIIATGFDSEGEATSMYLSAAMKKYGLKITRLASGVPVGGAVEYMDPATLGRALDGRKDLV